MSKQSMLPIALLVILIGFLARSWLLSFVPTVNAMERFTPPDEKQRRGAIGPTTGLPKILQRAFDPADHFEPIPAPGPSDWLRNRNVEGRWTAGGFVKATTPGDQEPFGWSCVESGKPGTWRAVYPNFAADESRGESE
jgi:hypothetical protein